MKKPIHALVGVLFGLLPLIITYTPSSSYDSLKMLAFFILFGIWPIGTLTMLLIKIRNPMLDGIVSSFIISMIIWHFQGAMIGSGSGVVVALLVMFIYSGTEKRREIPSAEYGINS